MGACREMRLPRSESESQSMSPSAALDSLAAAAARADRRRLWGRRDGPRLDHSINIGLELRLRVLTIIQILVRAALAGVRPAEVAHYQIGRVAAEAGHVS